ncbi:hypothetical protein F5884DRAFT_854322 [Xylogone sp. PMI_703]|nr:hypothetical protein F5884DRAFT_854322 [Xylogone sp. PMI_703]
MALANIQAETLNKFLAAWKEHRADEITGLWSEDFNQRILPLSLKAPAKSRNEAAIMCNVLSSKLTNWKLHIREIVHDASRGSAAIYAIAEADTPVPGEKWANEYCVFTSFSEDGTKITRLDEMVDAAFFQHFFPKFQRYLMESGGPMHD